MTQDYQEHQNEIHAKLVAIMSDRLAVHCGSLRVSVVLINDTHTHTALWSGDVSACLVREKQHDS